MAELLLLLAVTAVPFALGFLSHRLGRPWWWAAVLAVVVVMVAAIAPEPEAGESRLQAGDVPFLVVVALVVTGIVWLGARVARRLAGRHAGL